LKDLPRQITEDYKEMILRNLEEWIFDIHMQKKIPLILSWCSSIIFSSTVEHWLQILHENRKEDIRCWPIDIEKAHRKTSFFLVGGRSRWDLNRSHTVDLRALIYFSIKIVLISHKPEIAIFEQKEIRRIWHEHHEFF
jgi:hypothetical protein